jgi:hypothetical protein
LSLSASLSVNPNKKFFSWPHHDGAGGYVNQFIHYSPMRALGVELLAFNDESDVMVARSHDDVTGLIRQNETATGLPHTGAATIA